VSFDQYAPYGPVTETTVRIATWNVWGRFGQWAEREAGIEETLAAAAPDVVCLVESWSAGDADQPGQFARRLGFWHSVFAGDWPQEGWVSGLGLASRWPVTAHEHRALPGDGDPAGGGSALFALVDGRRRPARAVRPAARPRAQRVRRFLAAGRLGVRARPGVALAGDRARVP